MAWKWAIDKDIDPGFPEDLLETYKELYEAAEDQHYSGIHIDSAVFLLVEIQQQDGIMITRGIESAACMFASHIFWLQGVGVDRGIPDGYRETYERRFLKHTREAYVLADEHKRNSIFKETFSRIIPLDTSYDPLPLEYVKSTKMKPPPHELSFLKNRWNEILRPGQSDL